MFNKIKHRLILVGYGVYLIWNTDWHFSYTAQLLH